MRDGRPDRPRDRRRRPSGQRSALPAGVEARRATTRRPTIASIAAPSHRGGRRGGGRGRGEDGRASRLEARAARCLGARHGAPVPARPGAAGRPRQSGSRVRRQPAQHRLHGGRCASPGATGLPRALALPWRDRRRAGSPAGRCWLLKPTTYMNESGRAVGEAARFYKIPPDDVVVFHDELDLAAGKLRVKQGGGAAGHNGLRSIDAHFGTGLLAGAPRHRPSRRQGPGAGPRARRLRQGRPAVARAAAGRRSPSTSALLVAGEAAAFASKVALSLAAAPSHGNRRAAREAERDPPGRRHGRRPGREATSDTDRSES